jgi:hypothetical protein
VDFEGTDIAGLFLRKMLNGFYRRPGLAVKLLEVAAVG